ncbi:XRE family transcriptional regulator [Afipia sp. P52-10]|jgi:transcriptional regulator with XRE-family HTH domain|uniref:XRE family transcriptional regulator n=1 Tax=Afipia sp. P52-10 TaxID=1429916 RepID=UPI0003DEFCA4|nr:XRE family transcriptional regulator [Afipia sp. P52-10]ETR78221.1 XRE family transcriptional regulator [Afipia sp. P52-10]
MERVDVWQENDRKLAQRLRGLRGERRWSLDDLAARSGISRATLSRMENNEVSPSASVLGRLCAAYGLTMSRLLAQVEGESAALVARKDQPLWIDPTTGFRRRSLSPPAPEFECELLECELPAGISIAYEAPARPGLEHHLYLRAGALDLVIDGRGHKLAPGDCLRYRLYGASEFRTPKGRGAHYLLVVR